LFSRHPEYGVYHFFDLLNAVSSGISALRRHLFSPFDPHKPGDEDVVNGSVRRLGDGLPADPSPVDFDRRFQGDVVVYGGRRALVEYVDL